MIPQHNIDIEAFLLGFDKEKESERERTFGIINHTVVKSQQESVPKDNANDTMIQYITTKDVVCSIDLDQLLYNECLEKQGKPIERQAFWFNFYASGNRPHAIFFNTSQGADTFTNIVKVYNNNGIDVGDPEYFYAGDDDVLKDGEDNYLCTCGYYLIPPKKKFGFTQVIAYDKAHVDSDGYIEIPDEESVSVFDYRYKAIIMWVEIAYNENNEYATRISFELVLSVNGVQEDGELPYKLSPQGPMPERLSTLTEAITKYNLYNVHDYKIAEDEE